MIKKLDICYRMILNLLSTAYFHITILNRTASFNIYKNISLIFIIFSRDFYKVEKSKKIGFFFQVWIFVNTFTLYKSY